MERLDELRDLSTREGVADHVGPPGGHVQVLHRVAAQPAEEVSAAPVQRLPLRTPLFLCRQWGPGPGRRPSCGPGGTDLAQTSKGSFFGFRHRGSGGALRCSTCATSVQPALSR